MDFMVLFGGAFVPLALLAAVALLPEPRSGHADFCGCCRWGGAGAIWWQCAACVALLIGMISDLFIPRSQR